MKLVVCALWVTLVTASWVPAGETGTLRLKTRLAAGDAAAFQPVPSAVRRQVPNRTHRVLQFSQAPSAAQIDDLVHRGVRILQTIPYHGFMVSVPDGADLDGLGLRRARSLARLEKISPLLRARDERARTPLLIEFYPDISPGDQRAIVLAEGARIRDNPDLLPVHLMVAGPDDLAFRLAAWDEVAYVFPASSDLRAGIPVIA